MNVISRLILLVLCSSCGAVLTSAVRAESTTRPVQPCMQLTAYVSGTRVTKETPLAYVLELTNSCKHTIVASDLVLVKQIFAHQEEAAKLIELPDNGETRTSVRIVATVVFPDNSVIPAAAGSGWTDDNKIVCEAGKASLFKVKFAAGRPGIGKSPVKIVFTIRPNGNSPDEYARSQTLELNAAD
jgi:hypothetical protein